jgi:hypothetical protein
MTSSGGPNSVQPFRQRADTRGRVPSDLQAEVTRILAEADPPKDCAHTDESSIRSCVSPPDLGHPNAMSCPQCYSQTWVATPQCVHCGFEVKAYLRDLVNHELHAFEARRKDANFKRASIAIVFLLLIFIGAVFSPPEFGFPFATLALILLLITARYALQQLTPSTSVASISGKAESADVPVLTSAMVLHAIAEARHHQNRDSA